MPHTGSCFPVAALLCQALPPHTAVCWQNARRAPSLAPLRGRTMIVLARGCYVGFPSFAAVPSTFLCSTYAAGRRHGCILLPMLALWTFSSGTCLPPLHTTPTTTFFCIAGMAATPTVRSLPPLHHLPTAHAGWLRGRVDRPGTKPPKRLEWFTFPPNRGNLRFCGRRSARLAAPFPKPNVGAKRTIAQFA